MKYAVAVTLVLVGSHEGKSRSRPCPETPNDPMTK
jgi:hypothetical protein